MGARPLPLGQRPRLGLVPDPARHADHPEVVEPARRGAPGRRRLPAARGAARLRPPDRRRRASARAGTATSGRRNRRRPAAPGRARRRPERLRRAAGSSAITSSHAWMRVEAGEDLGGARSEAVDQVGVELGPAALRGPRPARRVHAGRVMEGLDVVGEVHEPHREAPAPPRRPLRVRPSVPPLERLQQRPAARRPPARAGRPARWPTGSAPRMTCCTDRPARGQEPARPCRPGAAAELPSPRCRATNTAIETPPRSPSWVSA